ncbi:MAG TPA: hypothetical protein DIC64_05755 [Alphaproteobacteria bacterium]|nr:hypothetical protein [Alphaproteobacteria bacterium]
MLGMMFALGFAYAQTNEEVDVQSDTLQTITPQMQADVDYPSEEKAVTKSDLLQLSALLSSVGQQMLKEDVSDPKESFFMIGKTKVIQTVEISTIAGKDRDMDTEEGDKALAEYDEARAQETQTTGNNREVPDVISNLNLGMNIGYSMIFIPGRIDDDLWAPNKFGFAYSTGFIASFDREDNKEVTCDFLWKLGVETGNGHTLGIGVDLLLGGGKTAGTAFDLQDAELVSAPYTAWCFKQGVQVWLKTNLLTTSIKNTDILAFARFVRSQNPYNDEELLKDNILNLWKEESWQFGITLRYRF